ncbi:MAG: TOBE domain-containing protein [Acidobacteria bacterium]|nr:TOBE domain-containing protein [Acidobacteriota bacterium]
MRSGGQGQNHPATVVEVMPNGVVKVELENRQQVLAHAAGVREVQFVRLRPGDKVEVSLSPQDHTRGRISGGAVTGALRKL